MDRYCIRMAASAFWIIVSTQALFCYYECTETQRKRERERSYVNYCKMISLKFSSSLVSYFITDAIDRHTWSIIHTSYFITSVAWWAWEKKSAFRRPHPAAMQRPLIRPYGNAAGRRPQGQPASREKVSWQPRKKEGRFWLWLMYGRIWPFPEKKDACSPLFAVFFFRKRS